MPAGYSTKGTVAYILSAAARNVRDRIMMWLLRKILCANDFHSVRHADRQTRHCKDCGKRCP